MGSPLPITSLDTGEDGDGEREEERDSRGVSFERARSSTRFDSLRECPDSSPMLSFRFPLIEPRLRLDPLLPVGDCVGLLLLDPGVDLELPAPDGWDSEDVASVARARK